MSTWHSLTNFREALITEPIAEEDRPGSYSSSDVQQPFILMCLAPDTRERVCIVGAGAAGMAAAWSLSRYPDRYLVTVIEAGPVPGGVACTLNLPDGTPCNYGVQGGSPPSHQNTIEMMKVFGVEVANTRLDVSFGKGANNWKNYVPSELQERLKPEIARFGVVLKWLSRLEFITIFMSIDFVLRFLFFSADFRQRMVYPLVALFFGTGSASGSETLDHSTSALHACCLSS